MGVALDPGFGNIVRRGDFGDARPATDPTLDFPGRHLQRRRQSRVELAELGVSRRGGAVHDGGINRGDGGRRSCGFLCISVSGSLGIIGVALCILLLVRAG